MKKIPRRQFLHRVAGAAALPFLPGIAHAQSYPARPVRMIVPYSPGAGTDTISRILAQKLAASTGQSFIVDNRVGAGGNLAFEYVAKSEPDGYTLLNTASSFVVNPSLYRKVNYRIDDFVVARMVFQPKFYFVSNGRINEIENEYRWTGSREHAGGIGGGAEEGVFDPVGGSIKIGADMKPHGMKPGGKT